MLKARIIPCLLLSNNGLVKTIKFKNEIYVGDPINAVRIFNEKEVDELVVLDIHASRNNAGPNFEMISKITDECFMPLAYGGGIRNVEDIKNIFAIGVEKVIINSSAALDPNLISEASRRFGSQSIVVSVDIKKTIFGGYSAIVPSNKSKIPENIFEYLSKIESYGAGEILINDIDRDGEMSGMNLDLIKEISTLISVPLIAVGGVGSLNHIKEGIDAGASAISAGSFFVFNGKHKAVLISYPSYNIIKDLLNEQE